MVIELAMMGHAVWVPTMMTRRKHATHVLKEVIEMARSNNYKMIQQAQSTGDGALDKHVWQKTQEEVDCKIAVVGESWPEVVDLLRC